MDVEQLADARAFLERTAALRAAAPLLTNVVGSVAQGVADGHRRYERCWWWVAADGGEVVGAALRTAPFPALLCPMRPGAAAAIGGAVAAGDPDVPGVSGPAAAVAPFLAALGRADGARPAPHAPAQVIYELDALAWPTTTGSARLATSRDLELVLAFHGAFHRELGGPHSEDGVHDRVERGMTYLWEDDGEVVALAGHAEPVGIPGGTLTRVGPVYTPPPRRRRGYGAAVTAACSAALLDRGSRVMLYTDAANPTSNGVYQRLGYRAVGDVVAFDLA